MSGSAGVSGSAGESNSHDEAGFVETRDSDTGLSSSDLLSINRSTPGCSPGSQGDAGLSSML